MPGEAPSALLSRSRSLPHPLLSMTGGAFAPADCRRRRNVSLPLSSGMRSPAARDRRETAPPCAAHRASGRWPARGLLAGLAITRSHPLRRARRPPPARGGRQSCMAALRAARRYRAPADQARSGWTVAWCLIDRWMVLLRQHLGSGTGGRWACSRGAGRAVAELDVANYVITIDPTGL